jgi:hypothetical protein
MRSHIPHTRVPGQLAWWMRSRPLGVSRCANRRGAREPGACRPDVAAEHSYRSDVFGPELQHGRLEEGLGFMLRQSGLNRPVRKYVLTRYHELLGALWPRVHPAGTMFEPAAAFERYTGVTLEEYFNVGFVIYTRFLAHVDVNQEPSAFVLDPPRYFEEALVGPRVWATVIDLLSATTDELRRRLDDEDLRYGPTARAQRFQRSIGLPSVQRERLL